MNSAVASYNNTVCKQPALDDTVTELIARAEAATRKETTTAKVRGHSVTMNCLIRGRCGQICERLNRSRSDFQNDMAVSMIFKMGTCLLRLAFVTITPPPSPHHPAQWAKILGVINHLSLSLALSLARSLSLPPLFLSLIVSPS